MDNRQPFKSEKVERVKALQVETVPEEKSDDSKSRLSSSRSKKEGCKGHSQGCGAPVQSSAGQISLCKESFPLRCKKKFWGWTKCNKESGETMWSTFLLAKCKTAASLVSFVFGEGAWMIGWWPIWEGCNSELMWQVQWQNWCQLKLRFHQLRKCQQFAFSSKKKRRRNIYQMLYWAHDPYFVTLSGFAHCNFTFLEEPFVPRYL